MTNSISVLRSVVAIYFELLLLRKSPQDLPVSGPWLLLLILTYSLGNMVIALLVLPLPPSIIIGIFNTLVVVAAILLLLSARGLMGRLHQTLSAMMGCGTLLNLLSIPLVAMVSAPEVNPLLAMLNLMVAIWGFAVSVHIFRYALSIGIESALLINIGLFVFYYYLGQKTLQFLS